MVISSNLQLAKQKYSAKLLTVDEWVSEFSTRSKSLTSGDFGWCPGSLEKRTSGSINCPHCNQDTSAFPSREGTTRDCFQVHTRNHVKKGLYLIHVGQIRGEGDWLKFGSSFEMINRLFSHFRESKHEFCDVIYTIPHRGQWKTIEGVEGLINGRIRMEVSGRWGEEYFPFSLATADRICELMNSPKLLIPDLLDEVVSPETK